MFLVELVSEMPYQHILCDNQRNLNLVKEENKQTNKKDNYTGKIVVSY